MASAPLTIRVAIEGELLLRIKGSDTLHTLGTVTYEPDVNVVLQNATDYHRND